MKNDKFLCVICSVVFFTFLFTGLSDKVEKNGGAGYCRQSTENPLIHNININIHVNININFNNFPWYIEKRTEATDLSKAAVQLLVF